MSRNISILLLLIIIVGGGAYYYETGLRDKFEFIAGPILSSAHSPLVAGRYLADSEGRTLYASSVDESLKSRCTESCLEIWPVFEYNNTDPSQFTDALSKRLNIIKRPDGYLQYAYGTKPLYYYKGDKKPGDINGSKLEGTSWFVIPIVE